MNRTDKISILQAVKAGTPFDLAISGRIWIFNTTDEPDVYYDEDGDVIDIGRLECVKQKVSIMTAFNKPALTELMRSHLKMIRSLE